MECKLRSDKPLLLFEIFWACEDSQALSDSMNIVGCWNCFGGGEPRVNPRPMVIQTPWPRNTIFCPPTPGRDVQIALHRALCISMGLVMQQCHLLSEAKVEWKIKNCVKTKGLGGSRI